MRCAVVWLILCGFVVAAGAAPKPKPAAKAKAAAPIKLTPEIEKFAKEMGASFDELGTHVTQTEALERTSKYDEAGRGWVSIRIGAQAIENHAALAARAGAFGEPMRFPTKRGKLTPKAYVAALRSLGAHADLRAGKAFVARDAAEQQKRKLSFPEGVAKAVVHLETTGQEATALEKRDPNAALKRAKTAIAMANGLRANVAGAVANKRADANTTYPLKPKAATATEVIARLDALLKDQKARLPALQAAVAAAAPKQQPHPAGQPARAQGSTTTAATSEEQPVQSEGDPVETPVPGETCNNESNPTCDFLDRPCCPDKQCLPAGWICGEGCDGLTGETPERYECQDPDMAPKP